MNIIGQLNIKGVASGFGAFIFLYFLLILLTNYLVNSNASIREIQPIITFGGYLVWILSGYFTGFISKKSGILNGSIAGLLTPVVMIIYMTIGLGSLENIQETIKANGFFWLYAGFLLCGFGGLIWDIQKKILKI